MGILESKPIKVHVIMSDNQTKIAIITAIVAAIATIAAAIAPQIIEELFFDEKEVKITIPIPESPDLPPLPPKPKKP